MFLPRSKIRRPFLFLISVLFATLLFYCASVLPIASNLGLSGVARADAPGQMHATFASYQDWHGAQLRPERYSLFTSYSAPVRQIASVGPADAPTGLPTDPDVTMLLTTVSLLLSAGCGTVIEGFYEWHLNNLTEDKKPQPSPFAKRWQIIGLTAGFPTVLYLGWLFGVNYNGTPTAWSPLLHAMYIFGAFSTSQYLHSRKLSKAQALPPDSSAGPQPPYNSTVLRQ